MTSASTTSPWNGTRALVTGGAGLIGSHIVDQLLTNGAEVTILDLLEPQSHPLGRPGWVPAEARFVQGDIRDPAALDDAVDGVDVVFHQAAFGGFTDDVSKYLDVNTTGTARLYEALARAGRCSRAVVASSQAVYGEGLHTCATHDRFHADTYRSRDDMAAGVFAVRCPVCREPAQPTAMPEPTEHFGDTPYALSKSFEERTALGLGRQLGIPTVALRYAVTYGPRQSVYNPYTGVVSIFSTRLLSGKPPVVYEDGEQTRDFIFVDDVAAANLFVATHEDTPGRSFNVATGTATTVRQLVAALNELYGTAIEPEVRSFRPGDARHVLLDPSRLATLGFRAETDLRAGLAQVVQWIRSMGTLGDYFTAAEQTLRAKGIVTGG